jgi:hypothetical protein
LNQRPRAAAGIAGAIVLIAVVALAYQLRAGGGPAPLGSGEVYFSVDDGKTWFAHDAAKLPPFTHEGKQAVRAYVYDCGDGKPFVNHLERYTPQAQKVMAGLREKVAESKGAPPVMAGVQQAAVDGRELKRPGDKEWVRSNQFMAVAKITTPKCPDGKGEPVMP